MVMLENLEEHTSSTEGTHEGAEGVHDHNDFGIGTLVLAMAFGTLSRMYITHMTGLPYTVILLLIGLAMGILLHESDVGELSWLGDSLEKWVSVSPEVILFVFLPILIFESAFNTDVHIFQREFWQVLTLAGPGVVVATALTASVVKYAFPYEWGWDSCLMVGGMLSATDPVAVVALLKELGVSERLAVLIEGESLLNDATAIVVFNVFRDALVGVEDSSPLSVLETAARMSLGGPIVGMVLGMLGSFSLGYIIDDALTEITLTVIVCFSAFMISEATELEVSGVLAVVTTGLVMSFYARGRISPGVEESMHTFWSTATYVANTVIFFISGLIIGDRALFDSHVEARDWGLLGLLYVALQIIRCFVVVIFFPVLTRGGYGMNPKQLSVLAFAGLRGAVVLTLGLIVVEDERIEETQRGLILFYVAGIAAMTLCINGTLSGPLVHWLGLDRSTTAETEIFVRACSAIEARLEHKLDLLKGDRFLGDADWELVWRYIPVSTAKSYWHRIRHGNINLSGEEEEEINVLSNGHSHGVGFKGEVEFRWRQIRKWFTRRVLRLPGGSNYHDLPFRLRQAWYTYHKDFNVASLAPSRGEADQHRRDMELHRLNAEPRMVMEAEAWSNLNEEAETITQTPASSTLRKQLDNVGIMGMADAVGMMSDLGQAEMAQQAAGAASGTLLAGAGGPSAPGAVPSAGGAPAGMASGVAAGAAPGIRSHARFRGSAGGDGDVIGPGGANHSALFDVEGMDSGSAAALTSGLADIGHWGGSKEEARLAIEGIRKLKADRRRAAQAVAKAEARLTRLQKDVGLLKHKGEEEEMAEFLQKAKDEAAMMRARSDTTTVNGSSSTSELTFKNHANPLYKRPGGISSGAHGRFHMRTGSLSPPKAGSGGGWPLTQGADANMATLTVGHMGSGRAVKASSSFELNRAEQRALGPASTSTSSSAAISFRQGTTGEGIRGSGRRLEAHGRQLSSSSTTPTAARDTGNEGLRGMGTGTGAGVGTTARTFGATGMNSTRRSQAGATPEWDPYEDDEEHDDHGHGHSDVDGDDDDDDEPSGAAGNEIGNREGGRARGRGSRRGRPGRGSVIGPGAVTMGSMSEARVRFLTAVKAHCTERYRQGWLSSTGLRVLKENMDAQLDYEDKELQQWSHLSEAFTLPAPSMAFIRKIPLVGSVLEPYMYRRLTFIFELASNFIAAHEDVDILELLNEGPVAYQLALEKNRQLQGARATLSKQLPVFPELARSLKTQVAARYMLVQHRDVVREFFNHGHINEREFDGLVAQNNTARVRLDYHPHTDKIPDRVTLLKNVPFLRFLSDKEKEAIINDDKACQEQFYGSNVVLMQERSSGVKGQKKAGWYNVVRGAVRQTTEGLVEHTSLGGTIRARRLAKERLVNAGTVIGLDEQLLQAPYRCTYVTASFVHLFYFDKAQMLLLAEQYPGLKRGLWWLLAVSVVRHHHGFRRMSLSGVYQLMRTAEFQELKARQPATYPDSRHRRASLFQKVAPSSPMQTATTLSRHKRHQQEQQRERDGLLRPLGMSPPRRMQNSADDAKPGIIRAAASSLTESRHKLSMGMLRTMSRANLSGEPSREPESVSKPEQAPRHRVVVEEGSQVLLLRGAMLPRDASHPLGFVKPRGAVTIIRDVSGPVEFEDGSVLFIMPAVLMARSTSRHQLLMRDIEARYAAKVAGTDEAVAAVATHMESPSATSSTVKWNNTNANVSSGQALGVPAQQLSPSRLNLGPPANSLIPMTEAGELLHAGETSMRNAMATDAVTIAAADEANPLAHPDTLRRKRTMRDAALAAKASSRWGILTKGSPQARGDAGRRGSGSGREGEVLGEDSASGGHQRPLTRVALRNSRHEDSFVDMMDVPVAHMDEDSPRSSRAPSALLYPDSYKIDPVVHAEEVARRLEEDRLKAEGKQGDEDPAAGAGGPMSRAWGGGEPGAAGGGAGAAAAAVTPGHEEEHDGMFWFATDDDPE